MAQAPDRLCLARRATQGAAHRRAVGYEFGAFYDGPMRWTRLIRLSEEDASLLRSDVLRRNGGRLLSVALLGGLALNAAGAPIETMDAHAQPAASATWLSLEDGWLCRTWAAPLGASASALPPVVMSAAADAVPLDFTTQHQHSTSANFAPSMLNINVLTRRASHSVKHCSAQWHMASDGRLISDASAWVPNPTGDWPALTAPTLDTMTLRASSPKFALAGAARQTPTKSAIASVLVVHTIAPKPKPAASSPAPTYYTSSGIGPWNPVPGHPTYSVSDFAGDPYSYEFGVCTWWAWYTRRDEPQLGTLGVATSWISNARAHGMSVGSTPAAGATVVFAPGVQGAGGNGHVGHVVQLLGGGWFIISEMNFYWNGGGWGRVDYRYVHVGSGVQFIY